MEIGFKNGFKVVSLATVEASLAKKASNVLTFVNKRDHCSEVLATLNNVFVYAWEIKPRLM